MLLADSLRMGELQPKSSKRSFSNSSGIGLLVDNICNGSESIHDIPTISVARVGTKWFAADNRRLWVFKELEKLGKCSQIPVNKIDSIPENKMTTTNGGESVEVRGDPRVSRAPRHRNNDSDDSDRWDNSDDSDNWDGDSDY